MKSKLIDIFFFTLAGISGSLAVISLLKDRTAGGIAIDLLFLLISGYFVLRGFLDIKSENKKLAKNWQYLSWSAWTVLLIGVVMTFCGYRLGNSAIGWTGLILFLLCAFVVPEQENDKNLHVKRRDETSFGQDENAKKK